MKVKTVGMNPTPMQDISLTPELLAATGARYSRNNEGLEAILTKIEGMDQDKAVDSIFKMVDYGHQSIADMAPVAMFIDGVSLLLALKIWSLCPTAGGQESSTRYIKYDMSSIVRPPDAGIPFDHFIEGGFKAYNESYDLWSELAEEHPEVMGIDENLIRSTDEKDQKKVARMARNFAFDRARNYLPMCCANNMMLVMSARGWVQLIKQLSSDINWEANQVAQLMLEELSKVTPRLVKYAKADESYIEGSKLEFNDSLNLSFSTSPAQVLSSTKSHPYIVTDEPDEKVRERVAQELKLHKGRYDYFGPLTKGIPVRFGWYALTLAELRDLNRHRTGNKHYTLNPVGCDFADSEIERLKHYNPKIISQISDLRKYGEMMVVASQLRLLADKPDYAYYLPMGAQVSYEHITTADKFLYQCELRTGLGAHYTYAARMREVLELWHQKYPETRELIKPGTAEPE